MGAAHASRSCCADSAASVAPASASASAPAPAIAQPALAQPAALPKKDRNGAGARAGEGAGAGAGARASSDGYDADVEDAASVAPMSCAGSERLDDPAQAQESADAPATLAAPPRQAHAVSASLAAFLALQAQRDADERQYCGVHESEAAAARANAADTARNSCCGISALCARSRAQQCGS